MDEVTINSVPRPLSVNTPSFTRFAYLHMLRLRVKQRASVGFGKVWKWPALAPA